MSNVLSISFLALALTAPVLGYAQGQAEAPAANPCANVKEACDGAGLTGKAVWQCMENLKHGKAVNDSSGKPIAVQGAITDACKKFHPHGHMHHEKAPADAASGG